MKIFKLFYSWQSDLHAGKTRSFIRECIDKAIDYAQETDAIEAMRDEATKDTTGSPNIVTTLFSKIDDCDLFIADISLCYTCDENTGKRSPNPNVLLELGYAVKTLDWERIICLCNTDFGTDYPFDIAHNRITGFSLEGKSRKEVKGDVAEVIFKNIRDLRNKQPRLKPNTAAHIVGGYDFENKGVIAEVKPIDIKNGESYVLHNKVLLKNAFAFYKEIEDLTERANKEKEIEVRVKETMRESEIPDISELESNLPEMSGIEDAFRALIETNDGSKSEVVWERVPDDSERIKRWLGIEVPEGFFDLGGLKRVKQLFSRNGSTFEGTDSEKKKHEKLIELSYILLQLDLRYNYLNTFEGLCFIPLAIQNVSSMQDENIRVVINVESGEIIEPDEHLIWSEYEGLQGTFCRDESDKDDIGIIAELFILPEDGIIHVEPQPYEMIPYEPRIPAFDGFGYSTPNKTEKEYRDELEEFIASASSKGYYEFDVQLLRPGECKWFSTGMLIKPVEGKIIIHYQIHSTHSSGDLNGDLEYENCTSQQILDTKGVKS